jgi:predicted MFS family arabinose efflux permease/uncharacterized membrane protein HdeD (DUF308 family)
VLRLVLLFLGTRAARRTWTGLVFAALVFAGLAFFSAYDGLRGVPYFPFRGLGYALLVLGVGASVTGAGATGIRRRLRLARALGLVVLGVMLVNRPTFDDIILALIFGSLYAVDGIFRIAAAAVVRFEGWVGSMALGLGQLLFAATVFEPYPTHYAGTVPMCLAFTFLLGSVSALRLATVLLRAREGEGLPFLFSRGPLDPVDLRIATTAPATAELGEVIVHVWTPSGALQTEERRLLVDRYIAAVDARGVVSTGHAALGSDVAYISHYPGVEIDRSPDNFANALRASVDNDVPARFLPSYEHEAGDWCESTAKIRFANADLGRLRAFWNRYRERDIYNLTRRNCAITTVLSLETAIEGCFSRKPVGLVGLLRVLLSPELWVASQLRKRAEAMTWTPGLALDYARAVYGALREAYGAQGARTERNRQARETLRIVDKQDAEQLVQAEVRNSMAPPPPATSIPPKNPTRSLVAVIATATIFGLTYGLAAPLIAHDLERTARSALFIGLNAAMHAVGVLGIAPFLPALAVRFGSRRLIAAALLCTAVALPAFAFVPSVWFWFPLRLLLGVSAEVLLVMSEAWANQISSPASRGRTMAIYTGALSLGFAGGPVILSLVGASTLAYVVGAGIALFALLPIFAPGVTPPAGMERGHRPILELFRAAPLAMAAALLNAAVETAGLSFFPSYAQGRGFSETNAFRLVSTLLVGALVLQLVIGYLADRVATRRMLLALSGLACAGALAWPFFLTSTWLAFVAVFIWGGVFVGMYTTVLTDVGRRFQGADLVGVYSVMSVFWGVGALVGPSAVGAAVVSSPERGLPLCIAAGCALFFFGVLVSRSKQVR